MDLKENKYRIYLYQFSNIVLGTAVLALLLSINAAFASVSSWLTQAVVFVFTFFAIFHGWWRNSELYTTSKVRNSWVYLIGVGRMLLLLLALLWLQVLPMAANLHFSLAAFFGLIALASWTGWVQQIHFIRPLYGKARVMQKREFLADLFYAASLTLFVAGLLFVPDFVFGLPGFGVLALLILIGRPIAKKATPWTELEPPHRGGRRPRRDGDRRDSRARGDGQHHARGGRDGRDQRGRHARRDPSQHSGRNRRNARPSVSASDTRGRDRDAHSSDNSGGGPRRSRSPRPRRSGAPQASRGNGAQQKKNAPPQKDRTQSPDADDSDKGRQKPRPAYGRERRSKKPKLNNYDNPPAPINDNLAGNKPKSSDSADDAQSRPRRYGRKRVKARTS